MYTIVGLLQCMAAPGGDRRGVVAVLHAFMGRRNQRPWNAREARPGRLHIALVQLLLYPFASPIVSMARTTMGVMANRVTRFWLPDGRELFGLW